MMRNLPSSASQPADLRRRHQARRDYSFRWESEVPDDSLNCGLDLSVHRPSSPFSTSLLAFYFSSKYADDHTYNRFDSLSTPSPALTRDREFHVSSPRRRPRNSRGTKEAKRRRDARRNRRKLAAQFLDEQLSRDINETLTRANIHPPPHVTLPSPEPVLPASTFWPQRPQPSTALTRRSPSPFQLPSLDFSAFDVHEFPLLGTPKQSPPPYSPPLFTGVPSWCPQIPSLTGKSSWSCGWPKFFDLSHLPEKKASTPKESRCQELQIWQPDVHLNQRKQSRFFPPQPSPRPTVKLPSTSCTLHRSEVDTPGPVSTTPVEQSSAPRPRSISDAVKKIVAAAVADAENDESEEPNAVNLWHILSGEIEKRRTALAGERESSCSDESHGSGGVAIPNTLDEHPLPAELDSKEIPYIHANSLTGYANETAEIHSATRHPDLLLADSAIYLAEAISSTDDASADPEAAALSWKRFPPDPSLLETFELTPESFHPPDTNTDSDDVADSIAHFDSEQRLFDIEPVTPQSPTESACDLDTFLSMGHVENCWCRDCEEEPELVHDEWTTPLTESDGWMVWSATEDEETADAPAEPVKIVDSSENDSDSSWHTWATDFDWDDFYPSLEPQRAVPELEDEFLGYYDDGYAFSQESDNDWMWSWSS